MFNTITDILKFCNILKIVYNKWRIRLKESIMSDSDKIVSLKNARHSKPKDVKKEDEQKNSELVYCSFCGRPNTQVAKMVQGPGVNICSECTMIAVQYLILEDKLPSGEAQKILDIFWSKIR